MSLLETIKVLAGKIGPGRFHTPRPATGSECPHEAELLAYSLNRLPHNRREQLESHFLGCDHCRNFLVLFARTADDATEPDIKPLTDSAIKNQASRILTYIKEDDFNRRRTGRDKQSVKDLIAGLFVSNRPGPSGEGIFVSTRQLVTAGLMVSALAVGIVYILTRTEPRNVVAREAVALATKDRRLIEPSLSGDIPHSPYPLVTRGPAEGRGTTDGEDPHAERQFARAQLQVQFAEDASAPAEDRLTLAMFYLSRGEIDYTRRALAILEQLVAGPNPSAEMLNDTGVALYQLERYAEAIAYYNRALEKAPSFDKPLFNRALSEYKAGNEAKAREDWRQFIESSSDEKWKEEAQRRLNMK
jgi:hypothetical protein